MASARGTVMVMAMGTVMATMWPATAAMERRIVWLLFLDFWILEGDLQSQTRVFTVIIYPVLSDQMLRAATVVLNKLLTIELHTIPVLSKIVLSLLGCMYLASQPSHHPSGLKLHQLYTQSKKLIKNTHHCSNC